MNRRSGPDDIATRRVPRLGWIALALDRQWLIGGRDAQRSSGNVAIGRRGLNYQ